VLTTITENLIENQPDSRNGRLTSADIEACFEDGRDRAKASIARIYD